MAEAPLVDLPKSFHDARGSIQPLTESCQVIISTEGAIRANHYHRVGSHSCFVVAGALDYYHRPAGSDAPPERVQVKMGQMFHTPPMVEHAMVFTAYTILVVIGEGRKTQDEYEADVVRLVRPLYTDA